MTTTVFCLATDAAPGRPNEDYVLASPQLAIVIDGAGVPVGGCTHGVAWYSRQLATHTMAALVDEPDLPLTEGLARGIRAVTRLHIYSCDLNSDTTPCAAVGILRIGPDAVDTLALSDCSIIVDTTDGPQITCDLAIEHLAGTEPATLAGLTIGTPEHKSALDQLVARQTTTRNRDGGWWVAASDPAAAYHALTHTYPRATVRRAAAFTDGATRPVDQMDLFSWPDWLDQLDKLGPTGLIRQIRAIETTDPDGLTHPRTKTHDDATIAAAIGLTTATDPT